LHRNWWNKTSSFGPLPVEFRQARFNVTPYPSLVSVPSSFSTIPGETFYSIMKQNRDILVCFDTYRPGKRSNGIPDMYVLVVLSIPSPSVMRALERCAGGRKIRLAICNDCGGLAFFNSEAYLAFA